MSWGTVKCDICKLHLSEEDCQVVNITYDFVSITTKELYYCPAHLRSYDKAYSYFGVMKYYKEFEVDKDGKIVKN